MTPHLNAVGMASHVAVPVQGFVDDRVHDAKSDERDDRYIQKHRVAVGKTEQQAARDAGEDGDVMNELFTFFELLFVPVRWPIVSKAIAPIKIKQPIGTFQTYDGYSTPFVCPSITKPKVLKNRPAIRPTHKM